MSVLLSIIYLIATVTFVIGLIKLGHPETAKNGNLIAAGGMGLAIVGTIFLHDLQVPTIIYILIGLAILVGSVLGWIISVKVEMTKMPELVSLFNGFGGASAMLIGLVEFSKNSDNPTVIITIGYNKPYTIESGNAKMVSVPLGFILKKTRSLATPNPLYKSLVDCPSSTNPI